MHRSHRRLARLAPAPLLALIAGAATAQEPPAPALKPSQAQALDRISGDSLRGHLSFLASDLLEGRDTPSRGLDLAAEYIAAQFRRAGLEPVGDDGYFQVARWEVSEPDEAGFRFEVAVGGKTTTVGKDYVSLARTTALDVAARGAIKVDIREARGLGPLDGKVVFFELPAARGEALARQIEAAFGRSNAALLVAIRRDINADGNTPGVGTRRLYGPEVPPPRWWEEDPKIPLIAASDPALVALFDAMPAGPNPAATATLHLGEPTRRPAQLRNVVGLLKGSDPTLAGTCVMVTAHYDHLGRRGPSGTDRIFNGANDDGSGTVSVVELASALGSLKPEDRPRRSVLFVTFFGEEKGLYGSTYYGKHPVVPVDKTVADVNLEQVGRTDSSEGSQKGRASLTGFGYSDVSDAFVAAGKLEGVEVSKHPRFSDDFFGRSDNQALADLGVPAHTLCVAYIFPDYHEADDHWDRLDYANMARVDRMVGRALLRLADSPSEPKWDATNPRASKYLKAWNERHPR